MIEKNLPYVLLTKLDLKVMKRNEPNANLVSKESGLSVQHKNKPNNEEFSKIKNDVVELSNVEAEVEHGLVETLLKKTCAYCKFKGIKSLTCWQCQGCHKYLCKACFKLVHSSPFCSTQHNKCLNSANESSSLEESATGYGSSEKVLEGDGHILIHVSRREACFYCKRQIKTKCPICNLHLCNFFKTGRKCFILHHDTASKQSSAGKGEKNLSDNDVILDDIDNGIENYSRDEPVSDDDSDVEIISGNDNGQTSPVARHMHNPKFVKNKKNCFFCKTRFSLWRCNTCGKSLCIEKNLLMGKSCFHLFHSSPNMAKQPKLQP